MIVLHQVSHRLGEHPVLREISLTLTERRIGVIGPNGSGKSTFARLLNGLIVPDRGTVTVDGRSTARDGRAVRRRVGFVFTDPDAQIVMPTVGEDVAVGLRRSGIGSVAVRDRVATVLGRYGLAGLEDRPAHALSGGEKQLLALCSVLVTEPDILVCDEPTTLLDRRNARRVGELLTGLRQRLVLVTHDLDAVAGFERVLWFDDGRVVADGPGSVVVAAYRST